MSRAIDVVDQPELPTVRNWVQENYTLSNFQATCNECQYIIYFVCTEALQDHIKCEHEASYQFEESVRDSDWKIFRQPDDPGDAECVVCNKRVPAKYIWCHHHFAKEGQIVVDSYHDWAFKYFKQTSDSVFSAYCILCERRQCAKIIQLAFNEIVFLHFKMFHREIWGEGLPFSEDSATSLGVANLTRLNMFLRLSDDFLWKSKDWENREIAINWVKRRYELMSRFRARCKRCLEVISSIDVLSFDRHVRSTNMLIYDAEGRNRTGHRQHFHWLNFRILKGTQNIQCVICNDEFDLNSDSWSYHRHKGMDDNSNVLQYTWYCKYVKQKDNNEDFKGLCLVCEEEHDLDFMPFNYLFLHIFDHGCAQYVREMDFLGPGNDPQPRDGLAMRGQGIKRPYDEPSTSREIS
nr:PREDICTED: uncharacterized protein LOC105668043 [Linepithema humile]